MARGRRCGALLVLGLAACGAPAGSPDAGLERAPLEPCDVRASEPLVIERSNDGLSPYSAAFEGRSHELTVGFSQDGVPGFRSTTVYAGPTPRVLVRTASAPAVRLHTAAEGYVGLGCGAVPRHCTAQALSPRLDLLGTQVELMGSAFGALQHDWEHVSVPNSDGRPRPVSRTFTALGTSPPRVAAGPITVPLRDAAAYWDGPDRGWRGVGIGVEGLVQFRSRGTSLPTEVVASDATDIEAVARSRNRLAMVARTAAGSTLYSVRYGEDGDASVVDLGELPAAPCSRRAEWGAMAVIGEHAVVVLDDADLAVVSLEDGALSRIRTPVDTVCGAVWLVAKPGDDVAAVLYLHREPPAAGYALSFRSLRCDQ